MKKGVAKGRIDTTLSDVKRLIYKNNFSVTEAMNLLDIDDKIRTVIVMELQKNIIVRKKDAETEIRNS